MATFDAGLAAGYVLRLEVAQGPQTGNSSTVFWSLRIIKGAGEGRRAEGPHYWSANLGGIPVGGSIPAYDFRNYGELYLADSSVNLAHNAAGYLTASFSASYDDNNSWGELGDGSTGGNVSFIRIPKAPAVPTGLAAGNTTPSSVTLGWTAPDNMGAAITEYQVQYATDAGFTTSVGTQTFAGTGTAEKTVTGLAAGPTYWFRVRARNSQGYSGYSSAVSKTPALPAPNLTGLTQNAAAALIASWSAPSVTTGLVGYRVQIATNPAFTADLVTADIGNVLSYAHPGLAGGRTYYARVAARTAGGSNTFSNTLSYLLVLDSGDLDGWTRVGAKPAQISYFTASGLRRGIANSKQALWLESLSTAAVTLAADTFGIQKVITGLVVGKAYRFEATGTRSDSPRGDAYRLRVVSEASAAPVTLGTVATPLGFVEFVADATSVTVQILLAETVTVAGAENVIERAAFTGIKLLELNTDYPQRLRETVLESDLATHFDLACNSVGASWGVGKDGTTRFLLPGTALPVTAVFSDQVDDNAQSYIDISAGYDTRAMTNRLVVTNYGVDETRANEKNDELVVTTPASITAYGTRSQTLRTNLYSEVPYGAALTDRLAAILDARDQPELLVSQLRMNAQQDLAMANTLDVGQRIIVHFNGVQQDSQIIAITHDIQPTRWLVTIDLQPL
ncbi:fibronectin type III domain protein [Microterricola gilva]|uniref:Fibronectin type III domain protein n=1 Tax=Microterricola gilva TaxID=393267 RepID=A0A4V6MGK3_9MICO|nr:fibronectin type III domain-containing protein [Microterricola gilva]RZU66746.1 fibronectin type III domain protein [Microterricola gilva]